MNKCPIKGCLFEKRLVLCPFHWDRVDSALKLTVYDLSKEISDGELSQNDYQETVEKLLAVEEEIVKVVNGRNT